MIFTSFYFLQLFVIKSVRPLTQRPNEKSISLVKGAELSDYMRCGRGKILSFFGQRPSELTHFWYEYKCIMCVYCIATQTSNTALHVVNYGQLNRLMIQIIDH